MLETKKSRRAFVNIVFDGTLYIGIGVSIGTLLNSPIIGFMGVLMASMMKRMIGWTYDWVEDGTTDEYNPAMPPTDQRVVFDEPEGTPYTKEETKMWDKMVMGQEDDGEV